MSYNGLQFYWLRKLIIPSIRTIYETAMEKDLINRNATERSKAAITIIVV